MTAAVATAAATTTATTPTQIHFGYELRLKTSMAT